MATRPKRKPAISRARSEEQRGVRRRAILDAAAGMLAEMPVAEVSLTDVRVGADALFGPLDRGLELAQHFVHENRIRQAASSLGAAQYCIDEAVAYSNSRITWGKKLSNNQGIQFPLAHYSRDVFTWIPPGENGESISAVTFTLGPDGIAEQVVLENLNSYHAGTFTRPVAEDEE